MENEIQWLWAPAKQKRKQTLPERHQGAAEHPQGATGCMGNVALRQTGTKSITYSRTVIISSTIHFNDNGKNVTFSATCACKL